MWIDMNLDRGRENLTTYALLVFNQHQLRFANSSTNWSDAIDVVNKTSLCFHQDYSDNSHISGLVNAYSLPLNASSIQTFLQRPRPTSALLCRIGRSTSSQYLAGLPPLERQKEWHKEVVGWFQASFLLAKLNLLASGQGIRATGHIYQRYSTTDDTD